MKFICPLVVVEDIAKSRFLYEGILGQKITTDFGENVVFENGFAVHQKKHFQGLINGAAVTEKSNSFELYFEDDDIKQVVEKLKAEGFEFVHDIREQPWRQRVVRFYDYDGNIIEIGERLEFTAYRLSQEGLPAAEISRITYMAPEAVDVAVREYSK